ncbi:MAG: hypothetical protein KME54_23310 [Tolypothrix brevis GSE-NOS-MK-07-07A]|jgi:hypothetical protein|nr:hypothetical protein [Tolypothrix brevis GSE-NOS-MK-07-07A]
MSDKKEKAEYKKRIFYATPSVRTAFYMLSSIYDKQAPYYAAEACKKWIDGTFVFEPGNRTEPINIYIDSDIEARLKSKFTQRSVVVYHCVKREVYAQIVKWGCSEPQEFIDLMRSETPLQVLSELINNANTGLMA